MDSKYDFEGLTLPFDFIPSWVPILGYSAFALALSALFLYGVFAIITNINLNIPQDKYPRFFYNFEEYNFRYKTYLVALMFLSGLVIFGMLILSSVFQSNGKNDHPKLLQQWLIEDYGIEIKDTKTLEVLLNGKDTSEDQDGSENSKIFLKKYGILELIPSENNTFYLEINGEIAIPK